MARVSCPARGPIHGISTVNRKLSESESGRETETSSGTDPTWQHVCRTLYNFYTRSITKSLPPTQWQLPRSSYACLLLLIHSIVKRRAKLSRYCLLFRLRSLTMAKGPWSLTEKALEDGRYPSTPCLLGRFDSQKDSYKTARLRKLLCNVLRMASGKTCMREQRNMCVSVPPSCLFDSASRRCISHSE
jgi:hypothetical protein